ncbi:MAG: 4Fe-4S binding protein [Spirochaetes bacterium]|nr:4Fe-4S binding protein [Spirochaetota bacterium]
MKINWIYFSGTGNTKTMVQIISYYFGKYIKDGFLSKISNTMGDINSNYPLLEVINVEKLEIENYFDDFFSYRINENFFYFLKGLNINENHENDSFLTNGNISLFNLLDEISKSKLLILSFPVYFYQPPKLILALLKLIEKYLIYFQQKIDLIILTTDGGLPSNIAYYIKKNYKAFNVIFFESLHFEDSHPALRLKFNPLISKGYPSKKSFRRVRDKFIYFLTNYLIEKLPENSKDLSFISNFDLDKKNIKFSQNNPINRFFKNLINFLTYPYIILMQSIFNNKNIFIKMFKKYIISELCTLCFNCLNLCPTNAIIIKYFHKNNQIKNNQNNSYIIEDEGERIKINNLKINKVKMIEKNLILNSDYCIACYRCINICPTNAINGKITKYGLKYKRFIKKLIDI